MTIPVLLRGRRRSPALDILVLVLLALLVRGIVGRLTWTLDRDSVTFLGLAGHALEGDWRSLLAHDQHPLFPLTLAGAWSLFGDAELGGRVLCALCGALAVAPLYLLARRRFGRRAALLAGFALALSPYPARFGADVLSDSLCLLLFLLAVDRADAALLRPRFRDAALAGAASGLAYLARPEGLGPAGLAFLFLLLPRWRTPAPRPSWLRRLGLAATLAAACLLVAGPYLLYLRQETGEWMLTRKKSVRALLAPLIGTAGPLGLPPPAAVGTSTVAAVSASNPRHLATVLARFSETAHPIFLLLALAALGSRAVRRGGGAFVASHFALFLPLLVGLSAAAGYVDRRHVALLAVLVLPWTGRGMSRVAAWLRRRRAPRPNALVLGFVLLVLAPKTFAPQGLRALPERRAGEAVLAALGPGRVVAQYGLPLLPHYARARELRIGDALAANVIDREAPRVTRDGIYTTVLGLRPEHPPREGVLRIIEECRRQGVEVLALDPSALLPEALAALEAPLAFPLLETSAHPDHAVGLWKIGP